MIYSMYTGFGRNVDELGIEAAVDIAKEKGFSGVEFFYSAKLHHEIPSPEVASEYRKAIEARGLKVSCVSVGATIVRPNNPNEISQNDIDGLIKGVEFAAAVGSRLYHHTLFMGFGYEIPKDFTLDKKRELFLEGARTVATRAAELGIEVIYEPQGPFFNGYEEFCRLVRDMQKTHNNIGICCDFGNSFWVSEEPYGIFEELSHLIKHVHMKDYVLTKEPTEGASPAFRGGIYIREVPLGEGNIDIERIAKTVKCAGYSGDASIEDRPNLKDKETLARVFERARALFG